MHDIIKNTIFVVVVTVVVGLLIFAYIHSVDEPKRINKENIIRGFIYV